MFVELESIIIDKFEEGRARYGDLGLDQQVYTARIHAIVLKNIGPTASSESVLDFVKSLYGVDLYLATACGQHGLLSSMEPAPVPGNSHAWKAFENTYRDFIRGLADFFSRKGFVGRDLAESVLADLYLPDRSGKSRILSYDGRSSVKTWLRVVLSNKAINAQRSNFSQQTVETLDNVPDPPALERVNSGLTEQRYRSAVEDALHRACRNLTPRERLTLLWRYDDGLLLGQIAELLGVHQSNVTRQLERLQTRLRQEVVQVLSKRHRLSRAAIEECLTDFAESPHPTSILDLIKNTPEISNTEVAETTPARKQMQRALVPSSARSRDPYWPAVLHGDKRQQRSGAPRSDPQ